MKRKNLMRNTGTPMSRSGFKGSNNFSSKMQVKNPEEFKRAHGIAQDFEKSASDFFKGKNNKDDTDSLYNKKTFATTGMDMTDFDSFDFKERDPIYEDTMAGRKGITRIIIENPVLNNVYFQMLLFYNFFYCFLHFFLLFTILIYKLWIFKTREYKEYIAIVLIIFYLPCELASLYFGYKGNINETVSVPK
jgi:hypothetical protein